MIKKDWKKFRENFFRKCCGLICDIKPIDKPKYFLSDKYSKPEDWITYDYVEKIKRIDIKIGVRAESGKQKCGNNVTLQEPDITFSTLNNSLKTYFECKILGDNSKYTSKDGMRRFITEKYRFNKMPFYGMLGYIKNDLATERQKELQENINKKKRDLNLIDCTLIKNSNSEVIFKTEHNTDENLCNEKIIITHILHSWERATEINPSP